MNESINPASGELLYNGQPIKEYDPIALRRDEKNSRKMIENITIFCREKSIDIVIVSHDQNIVEVFCENKIEIVKEA